MTYLHRYIPTYVKILLIFQIGEITESPDTEYMSTSAILHYCKSKVSLILQCFFVLKLPRCWFFIKHFFSFQILLPYLKLLTIMGLRPVVDASNSSKYAICFSHFHSAQVAVFMFLGYILQYMACFRYVNWYNHVTSNSNITYLPKFTHI